MPHQRRPLLLLLLLIKPLARCDASQQLPSALNRQSSHGCVHKTTPVAQVYANKTIW